MAFRTLTRGHGGCTRKVEFGLPFKGSATSKLLKLQEGPSGVEIIWEQLASEGKLNLVRQDPKESTMFTITVVPQEYGSDVTLAYDFDKVELKGPMCWMACFMPSLLQWHMKRSIKSVWEAGMTQRGYTAIEDPDAPGEDADGAPLKKGDKVRDEKEESLLKAKAIANARARALNNNGCCKCLGASNQV